MLDLKIPKKSRSGKKKSVVNTIALKKYLLTVFDLTAIEIPVKIKNVELSTTPTVKKKIFSGIPKAEIAMIKLAAVARIVREKAFENKYSCSLIGVTKSD